MAIFRGEELKNSNDCLLPELVGEAERFSEGRRLEIDNNRSERSIKPLSVFQAGAEAYLGDAVFDIFRA